jgi:hypothetical protein
MTSPRQLEANRGNALKSTGPRTINGKQASRRNALSHGLTAETLIEPLEDPEAYRAFEAAIVAEYLPQSPVEKELVHRLASLFWRLRRATSIETGLLRMQSEILQAFRGSRQKKITAAEEHGIASSAVFRPDNPVHSGGASELPINKGPAQPPDPSRDLAISFLRLANLDNELIDRLSRYESGLVAPAGADNLRTTNSQTPIEIRAKWLRFVKMGVVRDLVESFLLKPFRIPRAPLQLE